MLVNISSFGNIGLVVWVIKIMGFLELVLVNLCFLDVVKEDEVIVFVSGVIDVL